MREIQVSRPAATVATDRRSRRRVPAGRGGDARGRPPEPAGRPSGSGRDAGRRRGPGNARGNRLSSDAHGAGRHLPLARAGHGRDVPPVRVCRRGGRARRGARARRGHPARAVAALRRPGRAPRDAPESARASLRRRLPRRAPAFRSTSSPSSDGAKTPRDRRHVRWRRLVGRRVAAEAAGLRRRRPLHEELGGRRYRRILHIARGPGRRGLGRRRHRHRARGGQFRGRIPRARVRALSARVQRRPHAESRRALQQRNQVPRVSRPRPLARRRPHRDGPLRTRARGRRARRIAEGRRRDEGPELFPAPADAGAARARAVPAG